MKKNSIVFGLACGFMILAVVSVFVNISVQIITTLSICSLLFSLSQAIRSFLDEKSQEYMAQMEAYGEMGNVDIPKEWKLMLKKYSPQFFNNKKTKIMNCVSNIVECSAVVVLICGLALPLQIFANEKIASICTICSFAMIFFSIWLVGIVQTRLQQWQDIQMFVMMQNQGKNNLPMEGKADGQAENAQPE